MKKANGDMIKWQIPPPLSSHTLPHSSSVHPCVMALLERRTGHIAFISVQIHLKTLKGKIVFSGFFFLLSLAWAELVEASLSFNIYFLARPGLSSQISPSYRYYGSRPVRHIIEMEGMARCGEEKKSKKKTVRREQEREVTASRCAREHS